MLQISATDVLPFLPIGLLVCGGLFVLLSEVSLVSGRRGYQSILTVLFALAAGAAALYSQHPGALFGGQATADHFSTFVTLTVCGSLAVTALLGSGWLHARDAERGEFYALALFAASGMCLLGMATDLLVTFIGIEVMSVGTYALAAWMRRGKKSSEAAFKYFILGAFSSALFLYGASLVYGATGSLLFKDIAAAKSAPLLLAGLGFVTAGFAFKVAAVPFHAWTPDVYEGAPTPVTAFMAAGVKTAAFAALMRVMISAYSGGAQAGALHGGFSGIVGGLAVLTMIFGNLLALPQRSVKRMLAYSSVAHAGYLLVAVVAAVHPGAREDAVTGLAFYLASYAATVIGAFAVVGAVEKVTAGDAPADGWDVSRYAGLARRSPGLAFAMAVFLISLAGIPPTAGFIGKLLVFKAAVAADFTSLAVVGVVSSALGAYYYLRVVVYMYMRPADAAAPAPLRSPAMAVALAVAAVAVIALGIGTEPVAQLAKAAATLGR